jgi:PhnB protein
MNTHTPSLELEPYLFFNGRCDEAIAFYRAALGAEVHFLMRYKESPDPDAQQRIPPGFSEKVMHATLGIGGVTLMVSDGCSTTASSFDGFNLSLAFPTIGEADKAFAALSVGGHVVMPMSKTFWSPRFGMVQDPFGVGWMITVRATEHPKG